MRDPVGATLYAVMMTIVNNRVFYRGVKSRTKGWIYWILHILWFVIAWLSDYL